MYFERARIPTSGGLTTTPLSRTAALDVGELLRRAEQARFAHEQAKERHEVLRRACCAGAAANRGREEGRIDTGAERASRVASHDSKALGQTTVEGNGHR